MLSGICEKYYDEQRSFRLYFNADRIRYAEDLEQLLFKCKYIRNEPRNNEFQIQV